MTDPKPKDYLTAVRVLAADPKVKAAVAEHGIPIALSVWQARRVKRTARGSDTNATIAAAALLIRYELSRATLLIIKAVRESKPEPLSIRPFTMPDEIAIGDDGA